MMMELMERLVGLVREATRLVVFSGAGISTESGIPDFRSPGGLWSRYDPNEFLFQRFLASEETRRRYWQMHTEIYRTILGAQPNRAHLACVDLWRMGRLHRVITQNIDDLHQRAGLPRELVIELHGNALWVACLSCGRRLPREEVQPEFEATGQSPRCQCGGLLKPATISFGQALPPEALRAAEEAARSCDLFLVVGSSLVVHPAALMPLYAKESGARLVMVNLSSTPYDDQADLIVRQPAGQTLGRLVELLQGGPADA